MNIIIFETEKWQHGPFEKLAADHALFFVDEPLTAESAERFLNADIISTFVHSDLTIATLAKLENLKLIVTRSTGFDHIDIGYCLDRNIKVANVPAYGETPVAEHVFALLLALSHRLVESVNRTSRGDFSQQGLRGFDLKGKTMGVIGAGAIGMAVIRIANGFGMETIAFDPNPDKPAAERLGFEYVNFEALLKRAEVITLHAPANEYTYNMLAREQFDKMKEGVVIINTARGSLIDVVELASALASGKVAAAGLDVLPEESLIREQDEIIHSLYQEKSELAPLLADQLLLRLPNVIVTPHNAFNTREALLEIVETTADNISGFLSGKPKNLVGGTG